MKRKIMQLAVFSLGLSSGSSFAHDLGVVKVTLPDYNVSLNINGGIKADQTFFMGNAESKYSESGKHNFRTGATVKPWLDFGGDIGDDFSYTLGLAAGSDSKVSIEDAFVTYNGFRDGIDVSFGQLYSGFSLENTASSKWIPFLVRSMPSTTFSVPSGIGVSVSYWSDRYNLILDATQPQFGSSTPIGFDEFKPTSQAKELKKSDKWDFSIRGAYAPIFTRENIVQIGFSVHHSRDGGKVIDFSSTPEAKARITDNYLSTGSAKKDETFFSDKIIVANHHNTYDLELSMQHGPWYAEAEYQKNNINRKNSPNVSFDGWHTQVAYVLTGESRKYNAKNGTFGQVIPESDCGAWEVSARYSHLNLNDKNVKGGKGNNISLGLSYYANKNIRLMGNYVNSHMKKEGSKNSNLNIVAFRAQLIF